MLTDLDETIEQLLRTTISVDMADIRFEHPLPTNSDQWQRPTINVFLYDVQENASLRQHGWHDMPAPPGENQNIIQRKRKPIRLDYHYLISTWVANDPKGEHLLLDLCLHRLFKTPVLHPHHHLIGALKQQPFPVPVCIAKHEKATHLTDIWNALDNTLRPAISYTVTLALNPWDEEISGTAIHAFELRTKQKQQSKPSEYYPEPTVASDATDNGSAAESMYRIAGSVWKETKPVANIELTIQELPLSTKTNENGRFSIGPLAQGIYTLAVWQRGSHRNHCLQTRQIQVPLSEDGEDNTYNIYLS